MKNNTLVALCKSHNVKLTDLRKDIFSILYNKNKPLGAYDVLKELKKKRPNAEPPTVYRVLDFLVESKLIHRIDSKNTYVCCSHLESNVEQHHTVLLSCKSCNDSFELTDENIAQSIQMFAKKNKLQIDNMPIEIKGTCQSCVNQ
jgi:Fur family zinc uptake transcriptional regulator